MGKPGGGTPVCLLYTSILWNGIPVWENKEALSHICFSRELNQVSGNNMNALRIKDYLQAAEAFLPHWDKQMADSLVKQFQLDPKKRINKLSKGMLSMVTILSLIHIFLIRKI